MRLLSLIFILGAVASVWAQDKIELDTTTIKGNTELPKFLYVVPWQDRKSDQKQEQKLVLHNLYGDLFDPQLPAYIESDDYKLIQALVP
jgi:hypothetical protein